MSGSFCDVWPTGAAETSATCCNRTPLLDFVRVILALGLSVSSVLSLFSLSWRCSLLVTV